MMAHAAVSREVDVLPALFESPSWKTFLTITKEEGAAPLSAIPYCISSDSFTAQRRHCPRETTLEQETEGTPSTTERSSPRTRTCLQPTKTWTCLALMVEMRVLGQEQAGEAVWSVLTAPLRMRLARPTAIFAVSRWPNRAGMICVGVISMIPSPSGTR